VATRSPRSLARTSALAAGLPVVTTPVGGIPEVVKDGVNGLIISPGDVKALGASILRLLEDAELRERMSGANVELVRSRHDAPIVAATLCEWYDEVRGR
jgi:glycosyltransferase involved in cell wall biosynthesis